MNLKYLILGAGGGASALAILFWTIHYGGLATLGLTAVGDQNTDNACAIQQGQWNAQTVPRGLSPGPILRMWAVRRAKIGLACAGSTYEKDIDKTRPEIEALAKQPDVIAEARILNDNWSGSRSK
jgi:hypothetical protein